LAVQQACVGAECLVDAGREGALNVV
jgi:hypothetical protein